MSGSAKRTTSAHRQNTKTVDVFVARRPRRRRAVRRTLRRGPAGLSSGLSEYLATLKDPFEHGPLYLGYDCFVPSFLATAYVRGGISVASDGSFAMALFPVCKGMVQYNTGGLSTTTWSSTDATNLSSINNNFSQGRVVSGGIRLVANCAATSAPGTLWAGNLYDVAPGNIAFAPQTLINFPGTEMAIGHRGVRNVIYPEDNGAFAFTIPCVQASSVPTTVAASSAPFICGQGWPTGSNTTIYWEAVLNLECLPADTNGGIGHGEAPTSAQQSSLLREFPSTDALMGEALKYVGDPVTLDAVQGLSGLASNIPGPVGAAAGVISSTIGRTRRLRNLAVGNGFRLSARSATSAIESLGNIAMLD
jgi:hypothetical protein